MRIVICGGGVIGTSIAHFLSVRGAEVVVVEGTAVAAAASGKSGGFLALDWCDGSPLGPLARRSFALHAELAATQIGQWGYRRLDTSSIATSARRPSTRPGQTPLPNWVAEGARLQQRLGTTATTAQVDPAAFTRAMMAAASARGARLVIGRVGGLARAGDRVVGAVVDDRMVEGDAVVIAMGPWSVLASAWLPLPAVYGLKGHSVVFRPAVPVSADALFVDHESADGTVDSPEVYPRPDGTTYVCGLSSQAPLPVDPAVIEPDPGACDRLVALSHAISPALAGAEIITRQACHRPITQDGLPLIGRLGGAANAYVATGHSVWGMLNAPATGEAMAELIMDGEARTIDLAAFDPARLPALDRDAWQR